MEEKIERTLFFIKPDCETPKIDKASALEIIAFLENKLEKDFKRVFGKRTKDLPEEFYRDFYSQLEKDWPDVLEKMSTEFTDKSIAVFVYEGPNIMQRIRDIMGPRLYEENIGEGTIRELFGTSDMGYKTVVHASDKEGKRKDFLVFKKWNLIPDYL